MSKGYKIAAIPTTYCGRRYRSRLEARWAAFFDRITWSYEYEPFDLGKWSPDFMVKQRYLNSNPFLFEVKPFQDFDLGVAERMRDAAWESGLPVLLTRIAPCRLPGKPGISIGWTWNSVAMEWADAMLGYSPAAAYPTIFSIADDAMEWGGDYSRHFRKLSHIVLNEKQTEHYWSEATNSVQWKRPEPQPGANLTKGMQG